METTKFKDWHATKLLLWHFNENYSVKLTIVDTPGWFHDLKAKSQAFPLRYVQCIGKFQEIKSIWNLYPALSSLRPNVQNQPYLSQNIQKYQTNQRNLHTVTSGSMHLKAETLKKLEDGNRLRPGRRTKIERNQHNYLPDVNRVLPKLSEFYR